MCSDSGAPRRAEAEYSDALDGLYPVAGWPEPDEGAFRGSADLAECCSWSKRSAHALDELRKNLVRFDSEDWLPFENLIVSGSSYSFLTSLGVLKLAHDELRDRQDAIDAIAERLAARRLIEFGDDGAGVTVCGRPYPSNLDGLLDVQKRLRVLIDPLGELIISAVASAIPDAMSRTPHLAPFYAGYADNEFVPCDGLDRAFVETLASCPEFKKAVTNAYCEFNRPRIESEIHGFDGQAVYSRIKAELALLALTRTQPAEIPAPVKDDPKVRTNPVSEGPTPEAQLAPCHDRALAGYQFAAERLGGEPTDLQAYKWLKEHRDGDEILPRFETWTRYLREARSRRGRLKNSPRHGRAGRSVVRWDQV
jgi:hypothetical protein